MTLESSLAKMTIHGAQAVPHIQETAGTLAGRTVQRVRSSEEAAVIGLPQMLCTDTIAQLIAEFCAHWEWEMICEARGRIDAMHPIFRDRVLASGIVTRDLSWGGIALNLHNSFIDWEDLQRICTSCTNLFKIDIRGCVHLGI